MKKGILFLMALLFVSTVAFASANDLAYKGFNELEDITIADTNDKIAVYDASTDTVKKMDATDQKTTGDITFRSTLIATGRVNAASTAASSSTNLAPSSLPYLVLRKYIGGASGLDNRDGGTRLQDGTPGQILVLQAMHVMPNGSWIVTPKTSLTLTSITFDAINETVTLLFVDSTIGWILIANEAATVVYTQQTGIPAKP